MDQSRIKQSQDHVRHLEKHTNQMMQQMSRSVQLYAPKKAIVNLRPFEPRLKNSAINSKPTILDLSRLQLAFMI